MFMGVTDLSELFISNNYTLNKTLDKNQAILYAGRIWKNFR